MLVTSTPAAHVARIATGTPHVEPTDTRIGAAGNASSTGTSLRSDLSSSSRLSSSSGIQSVPHLPSPTTTASHSPRPNPSPPPLKSSRQAKPKVSEIVGGGFAILAVIFGFFIWRYLFLRAKQRKLAKHQMKGDGEAAAGAKEMEELPRRTNATKPGSPMRAESNVARAVQTPSRRNDTAAPAVTVESVEDTGSIREVVRDVGERTARTAAAAKQAHTKRTQEVASVGGRGEQLQPRADTIYPKVEITDSTSVPQRAQDIQSPPTRIDTTSQAAETGDENPFTDEGVADFGADIESQLPPTDTNYTKYPAVNITQSAEFTQRTAAPVMKTDPPNSTSDTQSKVVLRLPLLASEARAIEKQREAFENIQLGRLAEPKGALSAAGVPAETTGSMGSEENSEGAATSGSTADLESAQRQNELLRQRIQELEEQRRLDWEQGLSEHPPPVYNA
ncbi:hypothetical protein MVEN_02508100 [Mycena venus]|uniref:Transmembrane protein n=1 Tax=Mycena venus TaxID=2733690 RepID=A0A8H6U4I0_9AGAR|nr:hypothetical protein MVEN_02508100 [Mycena venus]